MKTRFAQYLSSRGILKVLQANVTKLADEIKVDPAKIEEANRLLNEFPVENDYLERIPLLEDFLIAYAGIDHASKNNFSSYDEVKNAALSFDLIHFIRKAFLAAIDDLLDANGNVHPDIVDLLEEKFDAATLANPKFKLALISGYGTNIVCGSKKITEMLFILNPEIDMDSEFQTNFVLAFSRIYEDFTAKFKNEILQGKIHFDSDLRDEVDHLFAAEAALVENKDNSAGDAIQAQHNHMLSIYGAELLGYARHGEQDILIVIDTFLRNRRLLNLAIRDYHLLQSDAKANQLELLLTCNMNERANRERVHSCLVLVAEIYEPELLANETNLMSQRVDEIFSQDANSKHREILIFVLSLVRL